MRQVARVLFYGGMIDREMEQYQKKWGLFFRLFFICIDRETGSLLHMPYSGGAMEQPYKTMQVINYLQSLWIEKLADEIKRSKR